MACTTIILYVISIFPVVCRDVKNKKWVKTKSTHGPLRIESTQFFWNIKHCDLNQLKWKWKKRLASMCKSFLVIFNLWLPKLIFFTLPGIFWLSDFLDGNLLTQYQRRVNYITVEQLKTISKEKWDACLCGFSTWNFWEYIELCHFIHIFSPILINIQFA